MISIKRATIVFFVFNLIGCTSKEYIKIWESPKSIKNLSQFELIKFDAPVVDNFNQRLIIESIATELKQNGMFLIEPPFYAGALTNLLNDFQYVQKIRTISDEKKAIFKVKINLDEETKLLEKKIPVTLYSCNHLKKKNPCIQSSKSILRNGTKKLDFKVKFEFSIETGSGKKWHDGSIEKIFSKQGKSIPDPIFVKIHLFRQIARQVLRGLIPQKIKVQLVLKEEADTLASKMIKAGAYKSAINHLLKKNNEELTSGDYYYLGLCSELTNDLGSALRYYQISIDKNNDEHVRQYKNRIMKIINL